MRAFSLFFGLMLAALASIAVFTYPAWLLLHPHFDFPFHRIGERIGMLALLIGFVLIARRAGLADRRSLGYGLPAPLFPRELAIALLMGVSPWRSWWRSCLGWGFSSWSTHGAAGLASIGAGDSCTSSCRVC